MDNIAKSERVVANILKKLFDNGLRSSGIKFDDLGIEEDLRPYFDTSVNWLKAEGLIRFDEFKRNGGYQGMFNPTLTSKGFKVFNETILLKEENVDLKEIVRDVSNQSGRWSQLGEFTGSLLGSFTKSINS